MKLSVWVTVSDLVSVRQTFHEKLIEKVDKKHSIFSSAPYAYIFGSLKQAGVDGLELLISYYTKDADIKKVKSIVENNDIPVLSIHQSLAHRSSLSLSDIEKLCYIANTFSARVIVLHSGALQKELLDMGFINSLKKLQKKYSIIFGIENMDKIIPLSLPPYTYNGNEFSSCIQKTGLNITFDTTHLAQTGGDIVMFYLHNKEKIINIHASDCKRSWIYRHIVVHQGTHLPIGSGNLPFNIFLKTLKKEKYNGLITMEINANLFKICESAKIIKAAFA